MPGFCIFAITLSDPGSATQRCALHRARETSIANKKGAACATPFCECDV
jgi:hypothetical protein